MTLMRAQIFDDSDKALKCFRRLAQSMPYNTLVWRRWRRKIAIVYGVGKFELKPEGKYAVSEGLLGRIRYQRWPNGKIMEPRRK